MGYDGIQMLGFHGYMVCEINDKSMTFSAIKISLHIVAITYNWLLLAPFGSSFVHIVCFLAQLGQEDLRAMEKERHIKYAWYKEQVSAENWTKSSDQAFDTACKQ